MFGFLRPRYDYKELASAVIEIGTDPSLLEDCLREFARSEDEKDRVRFSAVIFVHCCFCSCAATKNDSRLGNVCEDAAERISQSFKDDSSFVSAGTYLVSSYELAMLSMTLETHFNQSITMPGDLTSDITRVGEKIEAAVRQHKLHLATLVKATIIMRLERFSKTWSYQEDLTSRFMCLAYDFLEQITGVTSLEIETYEPGPATEWKMRQLRGAAVMGQYYARSFERFNALR